jgi:hypothetical protein
MRTEPVSIPAAPFPPWAVLLLSCDRPRSVLSGLFSALRTDNRELTERRFGWFSCQSDQPCVSASTRPQGIRLSTAGHHRTDTSTMIELAAEQEGAVTPIGNKLNELPKEEGVFEADHCLPL